jgi:hypothetical protein
MHSADHVANYQKAFRREAPFMSPIALSGNGVPVPRTGGELDRDGDAMGTTLPADAAGAAGRSARSGGPTPPPVRPTIVLAGSGQHELAARLLGAELPAPLPGAYLVLRHGRPSTRAFIPGHRAPRDASTGDGPLTRPPRRIAMSAPAGLLEYAHLVIAPAAPPAPAATAVLADAVRCADGLVYLLDAAAPLAPAHRDELLELAAVAGRMMLVDTRPATEAERIALVRDLPALDAAVWHHMDDVAAIVADVRTGPWLGGIAAGSARPDGAARGDGAAGPDGAARADSAARADGAAGPDGGPAARVGNTITHDDAAWREVLATGLRHCRARVDQRFAADVDALLARCAPDPALLPAVLDIELHALSLRLTAALDAAARELVRAVFGAVVEGRLGEAELVRVTTAVWRQLDPDDRTLLITATAGVAVVAGAADSLSATGLTAPTLLPPICLAVSGNCHLMWQYRGVPDRAEARRWLHQAAAAVRGSVATALDARFAALAEAVEALAAEAVDHGVLLA